MKRAASNDTQAEELLSRKRARAVSGIRPGWNHYMQQLRAGDQLG